LETTDPDEYATPLALEVARTAALVVETTPTALEPLPTEAAEEVASASVTGQTVVEIATVRVVTLLEAAGQLVTVAAQLMMVETKVV
jgi:hypothetical protein